MHEYKYIYLKTFVNILLLIIGGDSGVLERLRPPENKTILYENWHICLEFISEQKISCPPKKKKKMFSFVFVLFFFVLKIMIPTSF